MITAQEQKVMSNMQPCTDSSDVIDLYSPRGLFLKPIAKMNISVQLPQLRTAGKSISNWEVMEKIKGMTKPHPFVVLKVVKSTLEFIRFEGEAENKSALKSMLAKLEGKAIKLSGFPECLKVKAAEAKVNFPTRHDWDSYFRDAKNMNEMEPGERPDTIHFQCLPSKWFSDNRSHSHNEDKPNESFLKRVCDTFGEVRCVDIPMLDPYRRETNTVTGSIQTFSFGQHLIFEAFVQYKAYMGFVNAMDSLRGMKLMYTDEDGKSYTASIKAEFDKTKHLSNRNMKKRQKEREKLKQLEKAREERVRREREEEESRKEEEKKRLVEEKAEKERKKKEKQQKRNERQRSREEKRRKKKVEKRELQELRRQERVIALEERKLLLAQRQLESIRLLSDLFDRVKEVKLKEELAKKEREIELERLKQLKADEQQKIEGERKKERDEKRKQEKLLKQEEQLKDKLLNKLRQRQEKVREEQREELRKKLAAKRSKLKSVLIVSAS